MKKLEGEAVNYILGHSERELERLGSQARHFEPFTRRVFQAAGLAPGMRVLDVGSGAGDVAFLAAELVGDSGNVVGADRVSAAIATARARAASKGLRNVTFREGDPIG
jgi:ubiquinone/menaquinone biosynthesis C-methylase UbiE